MIAHLVQSSTAVYWYKPGPILHVSGYTLSPGIEQAYRLLVFLLDRSWTQSSSDVEGLCERLKPLNPALIVLEPTGGYEVHVLNALITGGFRVSREHAFRIHHHAKGSGQLAKTDRLDAGMIAHCNLGFAPIVLASYSVQHIRLNYRRVTYLNLRFYTRGCIRPYSHLPFTTCLCKALHLLSYYLTLYHSSRFLTYRECVQEIPK